MKHGAASKDEQQNDHGCGADADPVPLLARQGAGGLELVEVRDLPEAIDAAFPSRDRGALEMHHGQR